jgi:hypothetical protein
MLVGALGAELLPALLGPTLLGLGTSTVGGALGGALAGGLLNEDDPLMGAALGGLSGGFAGPGLGELGGSLIGGIDDLLTGVGTVATGAPTSILPAAGVGSGIDAAMAAGTAGGTGGAAALAAPAAAAGTPSATGAFDAGFGSIGAAGGPSSGIDAAFATPAADLGSVGDAALGSGTALAGGGAGSAAATAGDLAGTAADTAKEGFGLKDLALPLAAAGLTMAGGQGGELPGEAALREQAKSLQAQSTQLRSGQLSPAIQSGLRSASEAAKASMRSMFASKGMSGSSSEVAALADIDQTATFQGAQLAQRMIETGINEAQLSTRLYAALMQQALERDQQLGSAIGSFATALAGGNPFAKAA